MFFLFMTIESSQRVLSIVWKKKGLGAFMNKYKKLLRIIWLVGVGIIPVLWYLGLYARVPHTIRLRAGKEESINLHVPASGFLYEKNQDHENNDFIETTALIGKQIPVSLNKNIKITSAKTCEYEMNLKLLGIIPFKNVNLQVVQEQNVIPGGVPIGIYVKTEGVLVIDTGKFKDDEGNWKQPAAYILQMGDYIEEINESPVNNKKEFMEVMQQNHGEEMILKVQRNTETIKVKIKPERNAGGEYKLGIWIRDSAQGIGTLTYVDENQQFGALGHGINDIDTSELMEVVGGSLYHTQIVDVAKGKSGTPGELTGVIQYNKENQMGEICRNTTCGIFGGAYGTLLNQLSDQSMPIGMKQDIVIGPAKIICNIGNERKYYDISITKLDFLEEDSNRGILIKVTDQELLEKTGGIVQGMSGSPIIQNGKLIGAVTHVFVNEPEKGYGIFIETMMEMAEK